MVATSEEAWSVLLCIVAVVRCGGVRGKERHALLRF
jgi:hypothetical protein